MVSSSTTLSSRGQCQSLALQGRAIHIDYLPRKSSFYSPLRNEHGHSLFELSSPGPTRIRPSPESTTQQHSLGACRLQRTHGIRYWNEAYIRNSLPALQGRNLAVWLLPYCSDSATTYMSTQDLCILHDMGRG